jgi:hypothetical protein
MATVYMVPVGPLYQALTDAGAIGNGYKLYTYVGGTVSTPQTTYTDSTGTVANSNPIILGSNGRFQSVNVWVTTGVTLKLVLTDSTGAAITGGTIDNVPAINNVTATGVTYTSTGTGAVPRTTASKLSDIVSVKDFGATGDGSTDDTAFVQAAITYAALSNAHTVYFPVGNYKIGTAGIQVPTGIRLLGVGGTNSGGGSALIAASASVTRIVSLNGVDCGMENFYLLGEATYAVIGVDIGAFAGTLGTPGRIYIKNVTSRLCKYGFHCINGPFLVHYESCVGWNCKKGWYFDATGGALARGINIGLLSNCHGTGNTEHGLYAVSSNALNIESSGFDSEVIGIQGSNVYGFNIRDVTMDNSTNTSIVFGGCTFNLYGAIFSGSQLPISVQTLTSVCKGTIAHCISTTTVGTYSVAPDVAQQLVFDANTFDKAIQNDGQRFGHADRTEAGSGTVSAGGAVSSLTLAVTFNRAFSTLRSVVVTPASNYTNRINTLVSAVTASGFTVTFQRDDGANWAAGNNQDFYYLAIGVN